MGIWYLIRKYLKDKSPNRTPDKITYKIPVVACVFLSFRVPKAKYNDINGKITPKKNATQSIKPSMVKRNWNNEMLSPKYKT